MGDDASPAGDRVASVAMTSDIGMSASMGVAAPLGAVSRRDRERAARISLQQEGPSGLVLRSALAGSVSLQERGADGMWQTLDKRRTSRLGRTRIELPARSGAPSTTFRVVFAPRNPNIISWISEELDG